MNNTSNRSTPRGLNARWQSGGDSIIDDSIPLTRLLSTVKHNATFPLFLYFFFLSLPPTAFKRYNILSQVAPLSQISPPLLLRFFDYRTKQPLSLSLSFVDPRRGERSVATAGIPRRGAKPPPSRNQNTKRWLIRPSRAPMIYRLPIIRPIDPARIFFFFSNTRA